MAKSNRRHVPCRECGKEHQNPASSSICNECGPAYAIKNAEAKREMEETEEFMRSQEYHDG